MKIEINGEITSYQCEGCFSPKDLKDILEGIDQNETLEVEITSEGGDVFSGMEIGNILSRWKGKVITHAVGLCASIASVILMSGDRIVVDENAFLLLHNPWTMTQGNAEDLMKQIDTLNKCKKAMMSYYMKHSKVSEDEVSRILDEETWYLGSEFKDVFNVEVIECDKVLNIAAKMNKFNNLPKRFMNMDNIIDEKIVEVKSEAIVDEMKEEVKDVVVVSQSETTIEETPMAECKPEETSKEDETSEDLEKVVEELKKENEALKEEVEALKSKCEPKDMVSNEECEKRVSGMQASMTKQINDFKSQLKMKEEELIVAKKEITSLNSNLEKAKQELSDLNEKCESLTSAYEAKKMALEQLNSNVNGEPECYPTMEDGLKACKTPQERVAFLKSGKYIR